MNELQIIMKRYENTPAPVKVGDRVTFKPSAFFTPEDVPAGAMGERRMAVRLTGRVIHVSHEHRHYTVEGDCYGYPLRETFKF